jgi:hypothetical protein
MKNGDIKMSTQAQAIAEYFHGLEDEFMIICEQLGSEAYAEGKTMLDNPHLQPREDTNVRNDEVFAGIELAYAWAKGWMKAAGEL